MPRLAVPATPHVPGTGELAAKKSPFEAAPVPQPPAPPPDDYKDRLVKYIPAESVALYTFTDKAVISYYGINDMGVPTRPADLVFRIVPWALFLIGLIGTPVYLYNQRTGNEPWQMHAFLSTVAFLLWAYTLNGSLFLTHQWYHPLLAGLAAPVFTFVAGFVKPR